MIFFIILCALLLFILSALILYEKENVIHTENSRCRDIIVCERCGERYMRFSQNGSKQTRMSLAAPDRLIADYTRMMLGAFYLNPGPLKILIIGLGGGTLARAVSSIATEAEVDIVEIDPAVIDAAKIYFNFKENSRIHIHKGDGRAFVGNAGKHGVTYDMVMLDAYDDRYIPGHMLTLEFLTEVKRILTPEGVLSANTWKSSLFFDNESVTYEAVFGRFFTLLKNNRVILAKNNGLPDRESIRRNSELLESKLERLGTGASYLLPLFSTLRNWNLNAAILTDQNVSSHLSKSN